MHSMSPYTAEMDTVVMLQNKNVCGRPIATGWIINQPNNQPITTAYVLELLQGQTDKQFKTEAVEHLKLKKTGDNSAKQVWM